jgi:molecular chaperone GrpE (heat shock protein)
MNDEVILHSNELPAADNENAQEGTLVVLKDQAANAADSIAEPSTQIGVQQGSDESQTSADAPPVGTRDSALGSQERSDGVSWDNLLSTVTAFEKAVCQRLDRLETVAEQLCADDTERHEQLRNREVLYEKIEASRQSFQYQLLRPFVQRLASLHDLLRDMQNSPPAGDSIAASFGTLIRHLEDTLAMQGIERVVPKSGDAFDNRLHYVIKTESTAYANQHERIATVLLDGFIFAAPNDRTGEIRPTVIRPARVVIWRHDPKDSTLENADESTSPSAAADGSAAV